MTKIASRVVVQADYTKILNSMLEDPRRFEAPVAWHVLLSLHRLNGWNFINNRCLAERIGLPYNSLRKHLYTLRDMGVAELSDEGIVLVWEDAEIQEEKTIAKEVAELPRTERTVPTASRWEMIIAAWNDSKPENYNLFGGKSEGVKIAIGAHMKRLGLETDAYEEFIGAVLRGCASDDWWSTRDGMSPKAVFGFGENLDDRKYEQGERLYRTGLGTAKAKPVAKLDDDASILAYANEHDPLDEVTAIERFEVPDADTADLLMAHVKDERNIPLGYINPDSLEVKYRREAVQAAGIEVQPSWLKYETLLILTNKAGKTLAWSVHAPIPLV
ncbi:MAG: hypothetical protein ACO4B5_11525 [Steroidobacteraceae bacterium]